jgi:DNA-binding NarL/FixJ family response regulator
VAVNVLLISGAEGDARLIRGLLDQAELSHPGPDRFALARVDTLAAGAAALASGRTDVVLIDISRPIGSGSPALAPVHAAVRGVPVVALARRRAGAALAALVAGADDVLTRDRLGGAALGRALHRAIERGESRRRVRALVDAIEPVDRPTS